MERAVIDETLFEAYLECKTKFYLKSAGKMGADIEFTNYKKELCRKYKEKGQERLRDPFRTDECFVGTPSISSLTKMRYRLIIDCALQKAGIRSYIHALEKTEFLRSQRAAQYVPIRFVPTEKVTKLDKLVLAFDGLVVSSCLGTVPPLGKIIHGSEHSIIKVRLLEPLKIIRSFINEVGPNELYVKPPNAILNKHCTECEFQLQCRTKAIEKDDLSLLSGLSAKERDNLHKKGIFTVTQLSYTFRPRRRPKRNASKPTKYYHSLKALAIRERKTFIVGRPQLNIEGTPVYLDVEGIPDQDFYYLIGFRFKRNRHFVQESLWASGFDEERIIWRKFLESVSHIQKPILVHYGSYETRFLKQMKERYGRGTKDSDFLENLIANSTNLLSVIHAQVYFPTYSNGLKGIAQHLGFRWSSQKASGANCLLWRYQWEHTYAAFLRNKIITYNAEDCEALKRATECVHQLCGVSTGVEGPSKNNTVHTDSMKRHSPYCLGKNEFATPEMEYINRCAYWDYQREKIYIKSSRRLERISKDYSKGSSKDSSVSKIIDCPPPANCPECGSKIFYKHAALSKIIFNLKFSRVGVKRWVIKYRFNRYRCARCHRTFYSRKKNWNRSNYGSDLLAYMVYQHIELRLTQEKVILNTNRLFGYHIPITSFHHFKNGISNYHQQTYKKLLSRIIEGRLIQADETKANVQGTTAYVWVLTNLEEVVYMYSRTREGDMVQTLLKDFKGILVSDFYSAYDSIDCLQQKCLIHLIRDLNDDLYREPFNEELKELIQQFGLLVRPMIETVSRYGLKKRHLRKHKKRVDRFYKMLAKRGYQSESNLKYKKRLGKYREKLFTFLEHDDIPWNNNNAEHAIKAFATLRRVLGGSSTENGIRKYLILLSIHETCKWKGIDFLQFLRSGQRDIDEFLHTRRGL